MQDASKLKTRSNDRVQDADILEVVDTRIAVVGGGTWGRNLVRCFAELHCLEAVVDSHPEKAEALTAQYGGRALSFDQVLSDSGIHGVVIATQPATHHRIAKLALEAGKHVLVEKPLTLDVEQTEELIALARRLDRRLMVGHILQYHPAFLKLRELVNNGVLGRILHIQANRLNLGAIRREEDVLWCLGPHDVSTILTLVGAEPSAVDAVAGFHLRDTIADTATLHLSFPGGERAQINMSWLHPFKEHRMMVIGSNAMIVFDDGEPWGRKLLLYPHQVSMAGERPTAMRADPVPIALEEREPLRLECEHFLNCIRLGLEPRTDGEEGLRVVRVLAKASAIMLADHRSADTVTPLGAERQVDAKANP
jgi:predicted dehydrogenase